MNWYKKSQLNENIYDTFESDAVDKSWDRFAMNFAGTPWKAIYYNNIGYPDQNEKQKIEKMGLLDKEVDPNDPYQFPDLSFTPKPEKTAQFTEENIQQVGTPNVTVQPYEPIIQEVVNEMQQSNPTFFNNVNKINVDMSYGQYGSVESTNPADININLDRIRSEVAAQSPIDLDINNPEHRESFKDAIARVIVHEKAHVDDAMQAQEASPTPLGGADLFPGGEGVADRAEQMYS